MEGPPTLDKTTISSLKVKILDELIHAADLSYPGVFDSFAREARLRNLDELGTILQILTEAMQYETPPKKYELLRIVGFEEDAARQISAYHLPFSQAEVELLNQAQNRDDFLARLLRIRPFLTAMIKKLEQNTYNTPYIVKRLTDLGLPYSSIEQFVIYRSLRPRSNMSSMVTIPRGRPSVTRFFGSDSPILIHSSWMDKIVESHQDSLFPVVRYGKGKEGLYTKSYARKTDTDFCGTFYYYETDSEITLRARDVLICPNKFCAAAYLVGIDAVIQNLEETVKIGYLTYYATPIETLVTNVLDQPIPGLTWKTLLTNMISGGYDFLTHNPKFYAVEDRFDQLICDESRGRFDLIVLTSMTGETRVVTEILDTRDRSVSYASLTIS